MDENLHKDPLEDLFRKNLEDQDLENREAAKDGWDIPSGQVWDNIGTALNPVVNTPTKGVWLSPKTQIFAIAASLLLILGIFTCFRSYQQQLNSLSHQVEQLTEQQKAEESPIIENPKPSQSLPQNPERIASDPIVETSTNTETETSGAIAKNNSIENTIPEKNTSNSKSLDIPPNIPENIDQHLASRPVSAASVPLKNQEAAPILNGEKPSQEAPASITGEETIVLKQGKQTESKDGIPEQRTTTSALTLLPSLPIAALENLPNFIPSELSENTIIKPYRPVGNKGFYAGVFYAPTKTTVKLKFPSRQMFPGRPDQVHTKTTSFQGIKLGYQMNNHWAIEMEGRYGNSKIQTSHPVRLRYSRQGERETDSGRFRGDYSYSIPTAYGEVDTDISLFREADTNLQEDALIRMEIKSEQKLQVASIPVALKYRLGEGPLRLTIRGGASANFLLKEDFKIVTASVSESGLSHHRTKVRSRVGGADKISFAFLVGLGLDYQINSHWHFSLEPTFSRALKPIFKNSLIETYPRSVSISAGINYQF